MDVLLLLVITLAVYIIFDMLGLRMTGGCGKSTVEGFIDPSGCHDCYMRNRAGNIVVTRCSKPWQSKYPTQCNCKVCYDPQYYNNDVPLQRSGEKLIKWRSKVCHCVPCTNSQIHPRPY